MGNQIIKKLDWTCNVIEYEDGYSFATRGIPLRRQDAPAVYDVNCCIYCYDRKFLMNENNLTPVADKTEVYVMPKWANIKLPESYRL